MLGIKIQNLLSKRDSFQYYTVKLLKIRISKMPVNTLNFEQGDFTIE